MSDEPAPMEGWNISSRRVFAGMFAILLALALGLTLTERRYGATIAPATHRPVHRFPTPRLDGFDDHGDPARPLAASAPLSDAVLRAAVRRSPVSQDAPR